MKYHGIRRGTRAKTCKLQGAARLPVETGEDAQKGGLPAPRGAYNDTELPRLDRQVNPFDRVQVSVGCLESPSKTRGSNPCPGDVMMEPAIGRGAGDGRFAGH